MASQGARSSGPPGHAVGALLNNGRYRVHKRLNKGATAVVYAAEDLLSGRPVALKVVQCGSSKVPLNVVRREVSLSSTVAHENMVQLLDVFAEGTDLIIVWELISGGDLLELLNECGGCMTETAAAFYYTQLLRGVLHIHAMGYCHRDIKPENCMIEASTQRLKLIDFGLSKHLESVATLGVGTPDYMPPEMVRSQMKQQHQPQRQQSSSSQPALPYDAKAVDAWAMGVLLYLLVTGCYPFEDPRQPNNLTATLLNVQAGRCQPLPAGISADCRDVIMRLLCPDPQHRTRLEDLAYNPWLLQSAAAHALKLGPIGAQFDPGNPAWILPAVHTTGPASAAPPAAAPTLVPARHSNNSTSSTVSPDSLQGGHTHSHAHSHQQQQQQEHAWVLLQQQQGMGGSANAAAPFLQHHQAAGPTFWPTSPASGTPQLQTGHQLRQQLAVHSAPGIPGQPSPFAGGLLHMPGQHSPLAAEGPHLASSGVAFAGGLGLLGSSANGTATAGAAAVGGLQGSVVGASAAGQGYRAGAGYWQQGQHTGYADAGYDSMDLDATPGQVQAGAAAAGVTGGYQQLQQHQQYGNLQQYQHYEALQQQLGVADSRAGGRDQADRDRLASEAGQEGKERRTGFNWLQNLVTRKR